MLASGTDVYLRRIKSGYAPILPMKAGHNLSSPEISPNNIALKNLSSTNAWEKGRDTDCQQDNETDNCLATTV